MILDGTPCPSLGLQGHLPAIYTPGPLPSSAWNLRNRFSVPKPLSPENGSLCGPEAFPLLLRSQRCLSLPVVCPSFLTGKEVSSRGKTAQRNQNKAKSRATWAAQQGAAVFLNKDCDIFLEGHQAVTLLSRPTGRLADLRLLLIRDETDIRPALRIYMCLMRAGQAHHQSEVRTGRGRIEGKNVEWGGGYVCAQREVEVAKEEICRHRVLIEGVRSTGRRCTPGCTFRLTVNGAGPFVSQNTIKQWI